MIRHILIPFAADIHRVSDPQEIATLNERDDLDRGFAAKGPLINRFLMRRVVSVLTFSGGRLPSIAARGDEARQASQRALQARLDGKAVEDLVGNDALARLAELIQTDANAESFGPAVQQAVGLLFNGDYRATRESWKAALTLDTAVRSRNPLVYAFLMLSGRLRAAKRILAAAVNGDLAGVHATGIAVHNLVQGFMAMRGMRSDAFVSATASADAAAAKCIFAPPGVLRQAVAHGSAGGRTYEPGTLFLLNLAAAYDRSPSAAMAFGAGAWPHCPAAKFVPALLRAVWLRAAAPSRETGGGHD